MTDATTFLLPPWQYPLAVSSVLVTLPAEEPLTVADAKLRAGLDWPDGDPRDELMAGFIAAARQKVEVDTWLALIQQTRAITFDVPTGGVVPIPAHALPLVSITDSDGNPVRVTVSRSRGTLTFPDGTVGTWKIVSGWPNAATLAQEAPLLVHAVGLLTAHLATTGRDLVSGANDRDPVPIPYGYDDAIHAYRPQWVI